jgi:hypothetical protein
MGCMSADLCSAAADCDDANPCTMDGCSFGMCFHMVDPTC